MSSLAAFRDFLAAGAISVPQPDLKVCGGYIGFLRIAALVAAYHLPVLPHVFVTVAITDVIAGRLLLAMIKVGIPLPHVRAGRLRVLAVTSEERNALCPEAATVAESGFPDFSASGWIGLSSPAGLPPDIVARLAKAVADALRDPRIRSRFAAGGYIPGARGLAEWTSFIDAEITKWGQVTRDLGLTLE